MSLLAVQDLTVSFPTADGLVEVRRGLVRGLRGGDDEVRCALPTVVT